ncbi:GNAT family N-acetyltransferase [Caballeronia sp. HLA56]
MKAILMTLINVHSKKEAIKTEDVAYLYQSVGFGKARDYLSLEHFRLRFIDADNVLSAFAVDGCGNLIGMARALTDDPSVTFIAEVCVHPSQQRCGVGKRLLQEIAGRASHTTLYADALPTGLKLCASVGIVPKPMLIACSKPPNSLNKCSPY